MGNKQRRGRPMFATDHWLHNPHVFGHLPDSCAEAAREEMTSRLSEWDESRRGEKKSCPKLAKGSAESEDVNKSMVEILFKTRDDSHLPSTVNDGWRSKEGSFWSVSALTSKQSPPLNFVRATGTPGGKMIKTKYLPSNLITRLFEDWSRHSRKWSQLYWKNFQNWTITWRAIAERQYSGP